MNLGIEGKTALVTGGANGIGGAITRALSAEGVRVFYTTRDMAAAGKMEYGQAIYHDLRDLKSLAREVGPVDILVNNAGSTMNVTDPYCDFEQQREVMRLNYEVPFRLCALLLPAMKERGWGRVVNISSCSGLENRGPVTFSAAKAALTAYTRGVGRILASEAPGVVMTAIFPGLILTEGGHWDRVIRDRPEHAERYLREQSPIARFGKPEEVACVAAFLCSDKSSFMHGALVPVDAGLSKHFFNSVAA